MDRRLVGLLVNVVIPARPPMSFLRKDRNLVIINLDPRFHGDDTAKKSISTGWFYGSSSSLAKCLQ